MLHFALCLYVICVYTLRCSHYTGVLPLVLLFGVATSLGAVHQTLPCHITSLLALQPFFAPLSSNYLSLVLEQVRRLADIWGAGSRLVHIYDTDDITPSSDADCFAVDISEPVFVLQTENGAHFFIMVFGSDGRIGFVDELNSLPN